jgi:hypothetical protein
MTKGWLLTLPKRAEACGGSRTRLPQHPTGCSAGRFAPCLVCQRLSDQRSGPALAGLGLGFLLRRATQFAPAVASH